MSMRILPIPILLAVALIAGCGQRGSVHQNALPVSVDSTVGTELAAHGESSETRNTGSDKSGKKKTLKAPDVPDGMDIVDIELPKPGAPTVTYTQWAALFLRHIDAPVCRNNVIAMVAWEVQEGTDAAWNPLATTLHMKGATRFNSVGVRNFVSLEQGLEGTALTLKKGLDTYGYGYIVQALRACAPPMLTAKTINASKWCHGCTKGLYVTGILRAVAEALTR